MLIALTEEDNHDVRRQLELLINDLLVNDFNSLISLLYTVDVNEQELKNMLQINQGKDSSVLIADMLIRRQLEKLKSKSHFNSREDIPEDEKW